MPSILTEVTEIATGLGTLAPDLHTAISTMPTQLRNVDDDVWRRFIEALESAETAVQADAAFANGAALLASYDGLRMRAPVLVEWKGPHRPPGDDVIPADLRIDHVFQVSCKYLSRIMQNAGPSRLFDRLLMGEERTRADWFDLVAPEAYQEFYDSTRRLVDPRLPSRVADLTGSDRAMLKEALRVRRLPAELREPWTTLCASVSNATARRWDAALTTPRSRLRMLWRLLRIGDGPYYVLGADGQDHLRLRVASAWDWIQQYELRRFEVRPRAVGQPEVGWQAVARDRHTGEETAVDGHVEIRWSHGRFQGVPEAKIYLDSAVSSVPGYYTLA